jgi:hypothetical protein
VARRIFSPAAVDSRFRELPVWMMLRPSQLRASAAESAMMIPSANKLSKRYRELTMPVTIIAGDSDKIADPDHNARRLAETLPGSELHMLPGTGHMPSSPRLMHCSRASQDSKQQAGSRDDRGDIHQASSAPRWRSLRLRASAPDFLKPPRPFTTLAASLASRAQSSHKKSKK